MLLRTGPRAMSSESLATKGRQVYRDGVNGLVAAISPRADLDVTKMKVSNQNLSFATAIHI